MLNPVPTSGAQPCLIKSAANHKTGITSLAQKITTINKQQNNNNKITTENNLASYLRFKQAQLHHVEFPLKDTPDSGLQRAFAVTGNSCVRVCVFPIEITARDTGSTGLLSAGTLAREDRYSVTKVIRIICAIFII